MSVVKLAFDCTFIIEEILNTTKCITSDFLDQFFKLLGIGWSELSWMGVDGGYESSGGLSKEGVEFFQLLVHVWDGVDHVLWYNSN